MEYNALAVILFGLIGFGSTNEITSIVDTCCSAGTVWATSNQRCDNFKGNLPALSSTYTQMCRNIIEVCCMKSKQTNMCDAGTTNAMNGGRCAVRDDALAALSYKECCQCCQMGLSARQAGMRCTAPSIGNPCDFTFVKCCRNSTSGTGGNGVTNPNEIPDDSKEKGDLEDIDECAIFGSEQICNQICRNTIGSFRCECNRGFKLAMDGRTCYRDDCQTGLAFNTVTQRCEDVDECVIGTHNCYGTNEVCQNRQGGFDCGCEDGFHRNRTNSKCEDIDECARRMDTCTSSQRCENTLGSYACRRIVPCGTGWTLDERTQECTDENECELKTDNCGQGYECFNIEGSFRCNPKRCPEGSRFNLRTGQCEVFNCPRGLRAANTSLCVDINECEQGNVCASYQTCQNTYGSYSCVDTISCQPGFEVGSNNECVDIDECTRGTHDCKGAAECVNRPGSYVCSCPAGYSRVNGICQDRNECQLGNVCPSNAVCQNTPGSFRCVCNPGFELVGEQQCRDVNECDDQNVCSQGCVNIQGSYMCNCETGYTLASDGRTCVDVDECRLYSGAGAGVCSGECINTPGSYQCSCPSGWRIMGNQRSCQDIDECEDGTARCGSGEDSMCFNTRGSYRCPMVRCPAGFSRSSLGPRRNSVRCRRLSFTCRQGDTECLNAPISLSYNFLTFPTNVRIPTDLFSMSGPSTADKTFNWYLNMTSALPRQTGVNPATRQDFDLRIGNNNAVVALMNRVEGPQDIELQITMQITDIYSGYTGNAISMIYLYVTEPSVL
ncbi:fibulin-5-like isoform X1 [Dreissena polymorpha]|uniref:fibulin-5-like isoform X1 n=2 Tax=Dreissena polymorpha TaxID=45954 RepID=UPI0022645227|nr:fibulin-5-like isoform X1 [Dreissena polymorpha]